jgi:hypothetical protein
MQKLGAKMVTWGMWCLKKKKKKKQRLVDVLEQKTRSTLTKLDLDSWMIGRWPRFTCLVSKL